MATATVAGPPLSEVGVAPGWRVEVAVTGIPRPIQLEVDGSGRLVVLSHGWRGDAAGEIFRLDVSGSRPVDAARMPRVIVPFAEGPRKTVLGSLAVESHSGDLLLGEENGNRVYRLGSDQRLVPLAVGLHHLVGGSGLAVDGKGRLVVLDFQSPETQLRSEAPPTGALNWLAEDDYQGPVVFRLDPSELRPLPRRLDLSPPFWPRGWVRPPGRWPASRLIAVAASPDGALFLLDSVGEVLKLGDEGRLVPMAHLPSGHYHRTSLAPAPGGGVLISTGFHVRQLLRAAPDGTVSVLAWNLGDPNGIAVDREGAIYLAETALHRILRIAPESR